mmetsp:Transcript_45068/g.98476  ORF Transcript_45068/g.98476 Transcript_45068/m.98476 type:complete len:384 (+) Transcript_45068:315-1466(+)
MRRPHVPRSRGDGLPRNEGQEEDAGGWAGHLGSAPGEEEGPQRPPAGRGDASPGRGGTDGAPEYHIPEPRARRRQRLQRVQRSSEPTGGRSEVSVVIHVPRRPPEPGADRRGDDVQPAAHDVLDAGHQGPDGLLHWPPRDGSAHRAGTARRRGGQAGREGRAVPLRGGQYHPAGDLPDAGAGCGLQGVRAGAGQVNGQVLQHADLEQVHRVLHVRVPGVRAGFFLPERLRMHRQAEDDSRKCDALWDVRAGHRRGSLLPRVPGHALGEHDLPRRGHAANHAVARHPDVEGDGDQRLRLAEPELRHDPAARVGVRRPWAAEGEVEHEVVHPDGPGSAVLLGPLRHDRLRHVSARRDPHPPHLVYAHQASHRDLQESLSCQRQGN